MSEAESVAWLRQVIERDRSLAWLPDVVADCEAKLGILGVHDLWIGEEQSGHPSLGAAACAINDAVRHLASAYRHRQGYAEHWGT